MPLPADVRDAAVAEVERFCVGRSAEPESYRLEHTLRGDAITIVERRPRWQPAPGAQWTSTDVARLRYDPASRTWTLYWPRASGAWHRYEGLGSAAELKPLLAEIDTDPDGVFWG